EVVEALAPLETSLALLPGVVVLHQLLAMFAALANDIADGHDLHSRVAQEAAEQLPSPRPHADDAQAETTARAVRRLSCQDRGDKRSRGECLDKATAREGGSRSHGRLFLWLVAFGGMGRMPRARIGDASGHGNVPPSAERDPQAGLRAGGQGAVTAED